MEPTSRRLVLVVEDDPFYAERISDLLQDHGLRVRVVRDAASAKRALNAARSEIEVALVDVNVPADKAEAKGAPVAVGVKLARGIKRALPSVRVVGMSSLAGEEDERWFLEFATGFIDKELVRSHPSLFARSVLRAVESSTGRVTPRSFIVHGHDEVRLRELVTFIVDDLGWEAPRVLRDEPPDGRTIIEHFEAVAREAEVAFVLLTPDDTFPPDSPLGPRARQNVILELGYFLAALERGGGRVVLLADPAVELPSDLDGVRHLKLRDGIASAAPQLRKALERWLVVD